MSPQLLAWSLRLKLRNVCMDTSTPFMPVMQNRKSLLCVHSSLLVPYGLSRLTTHAHKDVHNMRQPLT